MLACPVLASACMHHWHRGPVTAPCSAARFPYHQASVCCVFRVYCVCFLRAPLQHIPRERTTYLFSATMTSKVAKLQRASLNNPVRVEAATKYSTVDTLVQQVGVLSLSPSAFLTLSSPSQFCHARTGSP